MSRSPESIDPPSPAEPSATEPPAAEELPENEPSQSSTTTAASREGETAEDRLQRRRRFRYVTGRNAAFAALAIAGGALLLILIAVFLYRSGQVDRLIANQIKSTLAQYGIAADIGSFRTSVSPRTVEINDIELRDRQTGEPLGRVKRLVATIRIEDLFALNLRRNINLEALTIDDPEVWVSFDEQGLSNFRNLQFPDADPNSRILFSYSTASVTVRNAVIHYGDARHEISGTARNINLEVAPDDLNAPAESWMNRVHVALSDSNFVYDGREIQNIGLEARGRVNQNRAEIQELVLRSPIAEAHLQGVMDDWRALRYRLELTSVIDLTQASDVLQAGVALRGSGQVAGTVTGEGSRFQVNGRIASDALAADNVRLKALDLNAAVSGDGASYEAQGQAVAQLLSAGDFQLSVVQLAGGVMGTGTDFRWVGELRAAAARGFGTTITGLILNDTIAEVQDDGGHITASARKVTASNLTASGVRVRGAQLGGVRVNKQGDTTTASAASARVGGVAASGAKIKGVMTGAVTVVNRGDATSVDAKGVRVGGISAAGAQTGSINIAGVRLSIRGNGSVQGSSSDINVGAVAYADKASGLNGQVENVRLARPAFAVEPAGRYRVSADLSLGGGMLGQVKLGAAQSNVVATNSSVQFSNLSAALLNGQVSGNATLATTASGQSRVAANFSNLEVGSLLSTLSGRVVSIAAGTTGSVDLSFPGTNFGAANGRLNAQFTGETGSEASGRTPLTGNLALEAERGLFSVRELQLSAGASRLSAAGQFSLEQNSDLQIKLASTDATELQRVLIASGVIPGLEEQLEEYGLTDVRLVGKLDFSGRLSGQVTAPTISGQAALASVVAGGRNLGSLAATINVSPAEVRVGDGRLTEPDGGGAQFAVNAPLDGSSNIAVDVTLDQANVGNLVAAVPGLGGALPDVESDLSGSVNVTGLPSAMQGKADLRFSAGRIAGRPFEGIVAEASFNGSTVTLGNLDARFDVGRLTAAGSFDTTTQTFDLQAQSRGIRLDLLETLIGAGGGTLPQLAGTADITARAQGRLTDFSTYQITLDGQGQNVAINGRPAGVLTLVGRTTADGRFTLQATSGLLGPPQTIAASIDLRTSELTTNIETSLAGADLTPLFGALLPPGTNVRVTGQATGTLKVTGNLADENGFGVGGLRGSANFTELVVTIADVQLAAQAPLLIQFSPSEVVFEKTQFTGSGTNLIFGGTAALGEGGRQNLSIDGDLDLRVLNGLSPDIFLAGATRVGVRIGGTYAEPRLTGTAAITGGSFSTLVSNDRLSVSSINGSVRFTSNQAQVESLTGTLGGGRLSVSGGTLLSGLRPTQFRLSITGSNVTVPFPENFTSTADANLEVSGSLQAQLIRGTVNLRRAALTEDIDLADFINRRREASLTEGGGGDGDGGGGSTFGQTTQLDLRVEGREALVVQNNLADLVGSVAVQIRGPLEDPVIAGRVTATRGTVNFREERYELTRAIVDLPPRRSIDPQLNLQAEAEISGYRVIVSLTGPLSQPQAVLRSEPGLPQADVVALITTGDLATGEAGVSTLAGATTNLLTDTLLNDRVERATDKLFGLNRFEVDPLGNRGGVRFAPRLTVGRQINRNLVVTYSVSLTADQNQVAALEYRVSDRLSFVARYEQGSVTNLNSSGNNNFGFEIRFRKRF